MTGLRIRAPANRIRASGNAIGAAMRFRTAILLLAALPVAAGCRADPLADGFRDPPPSARPATYYLWLNGHVDLGHVETELETLKAAGLGGLCVFDMGARGPKEALPPPGPAFLDDDSLKAVAAVVRAAGRLGLEVGLSVSSSWDMGGSWVAPEDACKELLFTRIDVEGPGPVSLELPFPAVSPAAPRGPDGRPAFARDVAVLAAPAVRPLPGHAFIFKLDPTGPSEIARAVFHNVPGDFAAKDVSVAVSSGAPREAEFREVLRAALKPEAGPQEFPCAAQDVRFIRLRVLGGQDPAQAEVRLAEFEARSPDGRNVVGSHEADRTRDGAELVRFTSARGLDREWTADNIHDGVTGGPAGSWASAGPPALAIDDPGAVIDLSGRMDAAGRLAWDAPPGRWAVWRFACANTGERLKIPSPRSDGLATDHLSAAATRRYIAYVTGRLRRALGDPGTTALRSLYLASYEVRGRIWTPDLPAEFLRRRGYDLVRFLPVFAGCSVGGEEATERFIYDYRKTLGDLVVDAYYRAACEEAHAAGLLVESEAGGPGPPIHQVPVDALKALGAVDVVRGEFWPTRPKADRLWVVKETACAAHLYGKPVVNMEAFTTTDHWREGPQDLKPAADRAFCEGANRMVWHTLAHQPPGSGAPGWVYGAGTHLNTNLTWWPRAKPFLDYLARASFLLQQGLPVSDVLYYYGDQGYNFVPPRRVDPSLGFGFDYDVTNPEGIARLAARDGRLVLPEGTSYEILVLPDREDMDLDVLRKVDALVRAGATVVGRKPVRANGLTGFPRRDAEVRELADRLWGPCDGDAVREHRTGAGRVIWGPSLRDILRERGIGPDFAFTSPLPDTDLDFVHRRAGASEIYFVRNRKPRAERVEAVFRVRGGSPEIWDPDTGTIRRRHVYTKAPGGVRVPLELDPDGAMFVVFRGPGGAPHLVEAGAEVLAYDGREVELLAFVGGPIRMRTDAGKTVEIPAPNLPAPLEVSGPWRVDFQPGRGAPASADFSDLVSWTQRPEPGIRYFSGTAIYRRDVEVPADWLAEGRRVILDLGRLWTIGAVAVNDREAGVTWKAPFRLDVTETLRPGINRLAVEVTNTWSNRLVGDAQPDATERIARTNITGTGGLPWAKVPLQESGLFGPVRLVPAARVRGTVEP